MGLEPRGSQNAQHFGRPAFQGAPQGLKSPQGDFNQLLSGIVQPFTASLRSFGVSLLLPGHELRLALIPLRAEIFFVWSSMATDALASTYFALKLYSSGGCHVRQ